MISYGDKNAGNPYCPISLAKLFKVNHEKGLTVSMNMSRRTATIILSRLFLCSCFLLCFMALVSCGAREKSNLPNTSVDSESIPDDVQSFMDAYLEACKDGPEESVKYVYYPEEYADLYAYHLESGSTLSSYEIKDRQRINDSLYSFHMHYVTNWGDSEGYTFVALIDDEYRIILNTEYIPHDLRQGVNEEDYYVELPSGMEAVDPSNLF